MVNQAIFMGDIILIVMGILLGISISCSMPLLWISIVKKNGVQFLYSLVQMSVPVPIILACFPVGHDTKAIISTGIVLIILIFFVLACYSSPSYYLFFIGLIEFIAFSGHLFLLKNLP